jgi:hypothetical protein
MKKQTESSSPVAKVTRQARATLVQSLPLALTSGTSTFARTRHARSLINDLHSLFSGVNWVFWHSNASPPPNSIPVTKVCEILDENVSLAIEQADQQIANAQIATFKLIVHPASALARSTLEQHRSVITDWAKNRGLDWTAEEVQDWRLFLRCSVALHNQTADLIEEAQDPKISIKSSDLESNSTAEAAMAVFGPLLLSGALDKSAAVEFTSMVADYIESCRSMVNLPLTVLPAFRRVREAIDHQPINMPVHELPLLFPLRLIDQINESSGSSKSMSTLLIRSQEDALRTADDYERLAARLRYPPCLLDCVAVSEPALANELDEAYLTVQATLLASADLLRALYRKPMISLGSEESNTRALSEMTSEDQKYLDEDLIEPDQDVDLDELHSSAAPAPSVDEIGRRLIRSPEFCEACFKAAGTKKFCKEHLNTSGQARLRIKQSQAVLPKYTEAFLALNRSLENPGLATNYWLSQESELSFCHLGTIEALQGQAPVMLAKLSTVASWGLELENNEVLHRLTKAISDIESKVVSLESTSPIVWSSAVFALADLVALDRECNDLCKLLDLLLEFGEGTFDPKKLLSDELRMYQAAFTADLVFRMAAMCNSPNGNLAALLPENIRTDFYAQWLAGYKPMFSLGHKLTFEAHDADFLTESGQEYMFSLNHLWKHFSRLAAWRLAQCETGKPKTRLTRLKSDVVLKLRAEGVSIEEIAKQMDTTPQGVAAAIERWVIRGVASVDPTSQTATNG